MLRTGNFELTVFSFLGKPFPISSNKPSYVSPKPGEDGALDFQQNFARIGTPQIDALFDQATSEFDEQKAIDLANQEPLTLHLQLAGDVLVRIVPGARQAAGLPQRDDSLGIGLFKGSDVHGGGHVGGIGVPIEDVERFRFTAQKVAVDGELPHQVVGAQ